MDTEMRKLYVTPEQFRKFLAACERWTEYDALEAAGVDLGEVDSAQFASYEIVVMVRM